MARCPHCGYKLHLIDIKAECPVCKVNIPNYNWEERLDKDAENAEAAFKSFRRTVGAFKTSLFGNKFRIARFVLTFMPLVFFLFPMVTVTTGLPFSSGSEGVSMLDIVLAIVNGTVDIGSMLNFIFLPKSGTAFAVLYAALVLVLLGVVAGVLNFVVILVSGFGYHAKGNIVCCVMSLVFFVAAAVCVVVSSSMFASAIPEVMSVKLSSGLFVGMALFAVNIAMNTVARKQLKAEKRAVGEQIRAELEESGVIL
ncbi:MAG: hypothetical protein IJZ35_02650 [Clostridia bacterium]|nr:hypothetical protein [Clostridia bacterium]